MRLLVIHKKINCIICHQESNQEFRWIYIAPTQSGIKTILIAYDNFVIDLDNRLKSLKRIMQKRYEFHWLQNTNKVN